MKAAVDGLWPRMIPLGEVNQRLIRGLVGFEMARFKFRKGCLTFYVYAVRRAGASGFWRAEDLRTLLEKVVALSDFVDHTAMLALPSQGSITFPLNPPKELPLPSSLQKRLKDATRLQMVNLILHKSHSLSLFFFLFLCFVSILKEKLNCKLQEILCPSFPISISLSVSFRALETHYVLP